MVSLITRYPQSRSGFGFSEVDIAEHSKEAVTHRCRVSQEGKNKESSPSASCVSLAEVLPSASGKRRFHHPVAPPDLERIISGVRVSMQWLIDRAIFSPITEPMSLDAAESP